MKLKTIFISSVFIAFVAGVAFFAQQSFAQSSQDYDFTNKADGTVEITNYMGSAKDVTIPDTLNNKPVTSIAADAFRNKGLTSVNTPETINTIGTNAFADNQLTSATIGKSNSFQPVQTHGALKTSGKNIVDQHDTVVQLNGVSLFHSNWGKYFTKGTVDRLVSDFQVTLIRVPMNIEATSATPANQGYLQNPEANYNRVKTVVDAAIANGVYVIIDWHDHNAEDHETEAKAFFQRISAEYKDVPNVLYEVYNEPNGSTWPQIKTYAEAVIPSIRTNSPNALIIVGTPQFSMRVDQAAANPITAFDNIAYTLHFYADGANQNYVRGLAQTAYNANVALFVTEWGVGDYTGAGTFNQAETDIWMNWLRERNISSAMWSVGDKAEVTAMLYGTASGAGTWSDPQITPTGQFIRSHLRTVNGTTLAAGAFHNNDLTSLTIRGKVRGIDQAFQENSYSDTQLARIFTTNPQNPSGVADIAGQTTVNPANITVNAISEKNEALGTYTITGVGTSDYAKTNENPSYYRIGQTIALEPQAIEGYESPQAMELVLASTETTRTLTYRSPTPGVPNTGLLQFINPVVILFTILGALTVCTLVVRKLLQEKSTY